MGDWVEMVYLDGGVRSEVVIVVAVSGYCSRCFVPCHLQNCVILRTQVSVRSLSRTFRIKTEITRWRRCVDSEWDLWEGEDVCLNPSRYSTLPSDSMYENASPLDFGD